MIQIVINIKNLFSLIYPNEYNKDGTLIKKAINIKDLKKLIIKLLTFNFLFLF